MFSKQEIQKILRSKESNSEKNGQVRIITKKDHLQNLLTFANIGNPVCTELDKPLEKINFLEFFRNIDYSFTNLPKETLSLANHMTIEKYKKVVEKIIHKLEKQEEVILNDILVELNYQNLGSAIYLSKTKEK